MLQLVETIQIFLALLCVLEAHVYHGNFLLVQLQSLGKGLLGGDSLLLDGVDVGLAILLNTLQQLYELVQTLQMLFFDVRLEVPLSSLVADEAKQHQKDERYDNFYTQKHL